MDIGDEWQLSANEGFDLLIESIAGAKFSETSLRISCHEGEIFCADQDFRFPFVIYHRKTFINLLCCIAQKGTSPDLLPFVIRLFLP